MERPGWSVLSCELAAGAEESVTGREERRQEIVNEWLDGCEMITDVTLFLSCSFLTVRLSYHVSPLRLSRCSSLPVCFVTFKSLTELAKWKRPTQHTTSFPSYSVALWFCWTIGKICTEELEMFPLPAWDKTLEKLGFIDDFWKLGL